MLRVAWVVDLSSPGLVAAVTGLRSRLAEAGLADVRPAAGADPWREADLRAADAVVAWADRPLSPALLAALADPAVPVLLAGPTITAADPAGTLAEAAGLLVGGATPVHDSRVRAGAAAPVTLRPTGHGEEDGSHLGGHEHVVDRVLLVDKVADDVEVLLEARVGLGAHPVLTWRGATATGVWTPGTVPDSVCGNVTPRVLATVLQRMAGRPAPADVGVGLLGYGAIGHEHSRAVRSVPGLSLAAVCDTSPDRLAVAAAAAPGVATTQAADELLAREDVDVVVVSTPPVTHADWALRALAAGKHVVVEKPFALGTDEADRVLSTAADAGLLAVVYQNRRFDPDHLAVRRLVDDGVLGDVFHIETFVGGYGHPCNLWHSDEGVSGGGVYDWGAHLIDQILDLVPADIAYVTAATHKRRWFDVTNADHSRVTVRFVDGVEAEFTHSDLAAALKPRWYVLGTHGAVVGHWRSEKVVSRNDIGTLVEDVLAPADSPPVLELTTTDGSVTRVATPPGPAYQFHRELADRIRLGLPMSVTGAQSRRVLSVMEAARASAADEGRPVVPR